MEPYNWRRGQVDDAPLRPMPDPAVPLPYHNADRVDAAYRPPQRPRPAQPPVAEPPEHPLWKTFGPAPGGRPRRSVSPEPKYAVPLHVPVDRYQEPVFQHAPPPLRHLQAQEYLREPEYPLGVSPAPQRHRSRFNPPNVVPDMETVERLQLSKHSIPRPDRLITSSGEYDIIRPLESRPGVPAVGGMNVGIYLIERRQTGELFVEKRLRQRDQQDAKRAHFEITALFKLKGAPSNVLQIEEAGQMHGYPYCSLVSEYCDSGTVRDHIDRYVEERKSTPEPFAWHVFAGITAALYACHYGVMDPDDARPLKGWEVLCHLDVKPSNVFLTSKGRNSAYPRVVLGDFGCAVKEVDVYSGAAQEFLQEFYTPDWLPPESRPSTYSSRRAIAASCGSHTDIWQAGAVIHAMCRLLGAPSMRLIEEERPCGGKYSAALNNMVTCCMSVDLKDRPTALDLVAEVKKEVVMVRGMVF